MKTVILAGGFGTRIGEESNLRPKPMIEIGGRPILWHIMKIYSHFGFNDFIICLGYKGYCIKEYFAHYFLHEADITFDFRDGNQQTIHSHTAEPWRVRLIDTGFDTMTGGRIRQVAPYLDNKPFMLTYGDGVGNIDINALIEFHNRSGKLATVTATQPTGRFGALEVPDDDIVRSFQEKPVGDNSWVNGGFFVLQPGVIDRIANDATLFEKEPLESLTRDRELAAFRHRGFWQPMDTLRDKNHLEELWKSGSPPWKVW